ncbi:MAG: discoidin domain-containing protein [Candidatus Omnitrophota bacterium]|jgi:hypothetical protein
MNRNMLILLFASSMALCGISHAAYDPAYIRNWYICGPFADSKLETEAIPDEAKLAPRAGDASSGRIWKEYDSVENAVDFEDETAFDRNELSVAYAYVEIDSPSDLRARMQIHSDDGVKIWLNGANVLTNDAARGMAEEDKITVMLKKGRNRLLVKVSDLFAGWMFSVRITDERGDAVAGLKYNPKPVPLERLAVRKIWASSVQGGDFVQFSPKFAVDAEKNTRWSSEHSVPQELILDFGSEKEIKRIDLLWENAYSKSYRIDISPDKSSWKEIFSTKAGNGGKDIIALPETHKGRFLKLSLLEKGTEWGNSLWDISVYGFVQEGSAASEPFEAEVEMVKPMEAAGAVASTFQKPNTEKNEAFDAKNVIDGSRKTRWSSAFTDPQWVYVDRGKARRVDSITLYWETAFAKKYSIDISDDSVNWKKVYSNGSSNGGQENITLEKPQNTRYIRVYCEERGRKEWGYSLWEIEIFGE